MATFKALVRNKRKDGFYQVYIRVMQNSKSQYIKIDKVVNDKGLTKDKQIKDPYVLKYCNDLIIQYIDMLNKIDTRNFSAKDIVEYISSMGEDLSFSEYARIHFVRMQKKGQMRNARNYELAFQHFERWAGTTEIKFSKLTSTYINAWIKSLEGTKRAKEMYPICIRQIFKAAILEYNDYDSGILRIKTNPWLKVEIPESDRPEKKAITAEECRKFFSAPLPETDRILSLAEFGRDVAMLSFCLAGMNTVDLYNLKKTDYNNDIISYNRAKTKNSRSDDAYMEIKVPDIIFPLLEKYKSEDEYLFNFHTRHSSSDSFGVNVNGGLRKICESMGLDHKYSIYTFRHTFGTIAQNDCKATISEIAFAMNHASAYKITRGYIKIDFSPAWELNQKVIDFIFFSNEGSIRSNRVEAARLRISPKYLIKGSMYFRGELLNDLEDIGFNNKEEVIAKLAESIPDIIPIRSMIQFKIENIDKGQVAIYERMKGGSV